MTRFKRKIVLSAIAIAGSLYVGAAGHAMAAAGPGVREQAIESAAGGALDVRFRYHGHYYAYRYHGKFFNHRSRKGSNWYYY